mmetsp:Transcript_36742/g.116976  ORF Transcript_36742/g.116976 Transcript_36742/m.116976 type:complete len:335 (-) Transcript_36742:386-1390(-)
MRVGRLCSWLGASVCRPARRRCFTTLSSRPGAYGLEAIAALLAAGAAGGSKAATPNVIVMTGAGVSVSAGIPDFRSPGTGLYDNLQEYGLPYAEAIFDLEFFRCNPQPFYRLCKELWPGRYKPTPAHVFISLLEKKGLLLRCFTQNIDSLESAAGLSSDKLVAAHGNFDSASVARTSQAVPIEEVKAACEAGPSGWAELNLRHGGLVKPDIVFFGEALPPRFFECAEADFPRCDLLLVMGTSLVVQPFSGLIDLVPPSAKRVLINRQRAGEVSDVLSIPGLGGGGGFDFDADDSRDAFLEGDVDEVVAEIVRLAGWRDEFEALLRERRGEPRET